MANKPASRNWNDVQIALVAMSMAATLGLWNLFAEPDLAKANESAREPVVTPPPAEIPVAVAGTPTALPPTKILLGGVAPETVVVVQAPSSGRSNRNRGGGGTVTTTRSS